MGAVAPPPPGRAFSTSAAAARPPAGAGPASRPAHDVVTQQQIQSLVGLEAARQMAGCDAGSCAADLGDALGVDAVVNVAWGKVGGSVVVAVKRTDVRGGGGKVADKRITRSKRALDAALDALPGLAGEALQGLATTTAPAKAAQTTTTTTTMAPTTKPGPAPAARKDLAIAAPTGLAFVGDGHGNFIAFDAKDGFHGALYAGTARGMYAQRSGGSASADGDRGFSKTFWDPRYRDGAERFFEKKGEAFRLVCGKQTVKMTPTKQAPTTTFYAPAWQRQALLLGRDDSLRYVVVDAARDDDDDGPPKDLHVYLGKKGKLVPLSVDVEFDDAFGSGGVIAVGDGVTIKLGPSGGSITEGATTSKLSAIDLFDGAKQVYAELKPWGDGPLGTPCDGR
jgi:hypothetical protein